MIKYVHISLSNQITNLLVKHWIRFMFAVFNPSAFPAVNPEFKDVLEGESLFDKKSNEIGKIIGKGNNTLSLSLEFVFITILKSSNNFILTKWNQRTSGILALQLWSILIRVKITTTKEDIPMRFINKFCGYSPHFRTKFWRQTVHNIQATQGLVVLFAMAELKHKRVSPAHQRKRSQICALLMHKASSKIRGISFF